MPANGFSMKPQVQLLAGEQKATEEFGVTTASLSASERPRQAVQEAMLRRAGLGVDWRGATESEGFNSAFFTWLWVKTNATLFG